MFYRIVATFWHGAESEVRRFDVWAATRGRLARAAAAVLDSERDRCGFDGYRIDETDGE